MQIGVLDIDTRTPDDAAAGAELAEAGGFASYWLPGGWRDPLTLLTVAGLRTNNIRLGSSIVATWGIHPTALAEQALTVNAAVHNRLILGVGLSHRHMVEGRFGMSYDRPIRHLREFLSVLMPLLEDGKVDFTGEMLSGHTELRIPHDPRPEVLVAALGPQSLAVTGRLADGSVTAWTGLRTLRDLVIPTMRAAAEARRPQPRTVASLPVCVTDDPAAMRARARADFDVYVTRYTTYNATFAREGVSGPSEVVMVGNEASVNRQLDEMADAGVDEFVAYPFGDPADLARTRAMLSERAKG